VKLEHCSLERLRRRLEEVDLQERLEVQVRDLLAILDAEELAELGVRDDAALEAGVKARVLLDVRRDELRDIRLALLRLGRQTHKRGELIGDRAELQERVVGAASLPSRALSGVISAGFFLTRFLELRASRLSALTASPASAIKHAGVSGSPCLAPSGCPGERLGSWRQSASRHRKLRRAQRRASRQPWGQRLRPSRRPYGGALVAVAGARGGSGGRGRRWGGLLGGGHRV